MAVTKQIKSDYTSVPLYSLPNNTTDILTRIPGGATVTVNSEYSLNLWYVSYTSGTTTYRGYLNRWYIVGEDAEKIFWTPNLLVCGKTDAQGTELRLTWNAAVHSLDQEITYTVSIGGMKLTVGNSTVLNFSEELSSKYTERTEVYVEASASIGSAATVRSNTVYFQYKKPGSTISCHDGHMWRQCEVYYHDGNLWRRCDVLYFDK